MLSQQTSRSLKRSLHSFTLTSLILTTICLVSFSTAYDVQYDSGTLLSAEFRQLAKEGKIHADESSPPTLPIFELERRQVGDEPSASKTTIGSTSSKAGSSVTATTIAQFSSESGATAATKASSASMIAGVTIVATPIPSPFDTSLGSNFTQSSCPTFFNTFLANNTFRSCVPISLMFQNSNSFFRAMRSAPLLATTLDAACSAPLPVCSALLSSIASGLISNSNCGLDYARQNPLVVQAYSGLIAYEPVYRATCLENTNPTLSSSTSNQITGTNQVSSKDYCFVNAITNGTSPADLYPYYTAIGMNLPVGAKPSCNQCLQETMEIFAGYAMEKNQPLANTYMSCAQQIDGICGASFANTKVQIGVLEDSNGAASLSLCSSRTYGLALSLLVAAITLF